VSVLLIQGMKKSLVLSPLQMFLDAEQVEIVNYVMYLLCRRVDVLIMFLPGLYFLTCLTEMHFYNQFDSYYYDGIR